MCLTSLLALHPLADKILCSLHCTCRPHWSSRCCGYSSPREILTLTRRWLKCAIGSLSLLLWLSLCAGCSPLMAFIHQLFGVRPVWRCLFPRRRIPHSPRPSNCCLCDTARCGVIWLFLCWALLAGVYISHGLAPPTAHVAAPDKLALTPLHVPDHVCVVPAPAAQQVAAIGSIWRAVAFPALSPRDPQFLIFDAVIGRFVHVQQVFFLDWYFSLALLFPA